MDVRKAEALAVELMIQHELHNWYFAFDNAKRRFGQCSYMRSTISLSRYLVKRNSEEHVRDVILHEIAHALVGPGHGHDPVWKLKCIEVGAKPERCYDESVVTPDHRYEAECPSCGKVLKAHRMGKNMRERRLWHKGCPPEGKLVWRDVTRAYSAL